MLRSQTKPMRKKVAVVLPAFNEAKAIGNVLANIPASIGPMDVTVVVVDDGSTDHTAEIARRHGAQVIRHLTNLGAGAATVTGMQAAKVLDADVTVTIDADGQHDPADIQLLVESLLDGPY